MRSWFALASNGEEFRTYADARQAAFPRLFLREDTPQSRHVAIVEDSRIVGGFSLSQSRSLESDLDIRRHWRLRTPLDGIRISRLWVDRSGPRALIHELFQVLHRNLAEDAYYYGILSLPLEFAKQNRENFKTHSGHLEPVLPLDDCLWALDAEAASEGRRLLKIYLRMGARPLGAPSGAPSDSSVRVALGIAGAAARDAWTNARVQNA
jgi:hypothetical protein